MKYNESLGKWLYEVGELVRVINSPIEKLPSPVAWISEMTRYCGKTVKIALVDESDGTYKIEGLDWLWWDNDFFESEAFVNEEDCDIELPTMDAASFFGLFKVNS